MSDRSFKITIVGMVLIFVGVVGFMIWDSGILSGKNAGDVSVSDSPPDAATFDEYFLARLSSTSCETYITALKANGFEKLVISTTDTYANGEVVDYNPESCTYTLDDDSTISFNVLYDPVSYDLPNSFAKNKITYSLINTETGCVSDGNAGTVENLNLSIVYTGFDCSAFDEATFRSAFDSVGAVISGYFNEISTFRVY
jgi:hypothetical protein